MSNITMVATILFVIFTIIIIAFILYSSDKEKPIGTLHINRDVSGFYLTEIEFDENVRLNLLHQDQVIRLEVDTIKNLYD